MRRALQAGKPGCMHTMRAVGHQSAAAAPATAQQQHRSLQVLLDTTAGCPVALPRWLHRATLPDCTFTEGDSEGQAGRRQRGGRRRHRRIAHRLALQALPHVPLAQQAVYVLDLRLPAAAQLRVWGRAGREARREGGDGRGGLLLGPADMQRSKSVPEQQGGQERAMSMSAACTLALRRTLAR